ncbi:MAG: YraN family protein [Patescibacteria group bacterium]
MLRGYKKQFGEKGENEACDYLSRHGYQIVERNFRTRNGEIDIIAIDKAEKPPALCFIEVKSRFSDEYGDPLEAITYFKLRALIRTAQFYILSHPKLPQLLRLDAIAVTMDHMGNLRDLKLVKNLN